MYRCLFVNFMLRYDVFSKALHKLGAYLSFNNSLWGKLFLSSPIMFDNNLRVTSVPIFVTDFNQFSCGANNFTSTVLYSVILCWYQEWNCRTHLQYFYSSLKSRMISFTTWMMRNIVVFPARSRFPAKFICCMAFRSILRANCLLRSIAISL